ncbi:protein DEHYDRATION-INDUCED 19 homolog 3-like [Cornus florida]|uniref:protein DEHYDRATION-INDUCED 19 homolog 3-like n=1 Tax=Cornus florida TaxID=4283 RepID=UPI002899936A|nr:protein DEHYDRATION-INDUCED 19 homolog 3-like [Cornus florida]
MDSDSWTTRLSSASKRYQSRSDLYYGGEEIDGDEEYRPEFFCPFCGEEYDIVGLCCHIDEEHAIETKNGVCPVCAKRVGMDLVGHITMQHGSLLKVQRKRRLRKGGLNSAFSILRKELREGTRQSLFGGSSCFVSSSNAEPDLLLSSFISNLPEVGEPARVYHSSVEASSVKENSVADLTERNIQKSPLSDKEQEEKVRKCEFVQELMLSAFLDDKL